MKAPWQYISMYSVGVKICASGAVLIKTSRSNTQLNSHSLQLFGQSNWIWSKVFALRYSRLFLFLINFLLLLLLQMVNRFNVVINLKKKFFFWFFEEKFVLKYMCILLFTPRIINIRTYYLPSRQFDYNKPTFIAHLVRCDCWMQQ